MNKELREALIRQTESRQKLNNLAEDATEETRAAAVKELDAADQAILEHLSKEPTHAPAELRDKISLGRYINAIAGDRVADGAEQELRQELKLSDQAVPLEALLPTPEERADVASPQDNAGNPLASGVINRTTGPMLNRVFTMTDSAFLGISMPMVPPGERRYPVMVDGTTASMQARGSGPDADPAKFVVVDANPHRLTGRYLFDLEGVAEMGGLLESTLRSDLRMEMGYQMDRQVLLGTNADNQVNGLINQIDLTLAPGNTFATNDANAVITWPTAKQLGYGPLDGRYIRNVSLLMGKATTDLMQTVYRGSNNSDNEDGLQAARAAGASIASSYQIPAPALVTIKGKAKSSKMHQRAILNGEPGAAVAPVWQGITMIRDPYSNARGAQVILTAHMMFDFIMRRKNGWRQYAIRTEK